MKRGQRVYSPKERIERLSMPEPNSGCWLWLNTSRPNAIGLEYGRLVVGSRSNGTRRTVSAHRFSYEAYKGKIPEGLNVLHKCDVTLCVNPDHLFVGTQAENLNDCYAKGRIRNGYGPCLPPIHHLPSPPSEA